MADNINTATSDVAKTLELQVLPADDLKDHASVRRFVCSEEFGNYAWLVYRVLSPEARLSSTDTSASVMNSAEGPAQATREASRVNLKIECMFGLAWEGGRVIAARRFGKS